MGKVKQSQSHPPRPETVVGAAVGQAEVIVSPIEKPEFKLSARGPVELVTRSISALSELAERLAAEGRRATGHELAAAMREERRRKRSEGR